MKITQVDLLSSAGVTVAELSLVDPQHTMPYLLKSIVGIDADEIVSKFYGRSKLTSKGFYELSVPKREVVIQIGLNPNYEAKTNFTSVSALRDAIYKGIVSTRSGTVTISFRNLGATIANLTGFVTKVEVPHFSKTPELQITISCIDPLLKSPTKIYKRASDLTLPTLNLTYNGTAPAGFEFCMRCDFSSSNFVIRGLKNGAIDWTFDVEPNYAFTTASPPGFKNGDFLYFSSIPGEKYLYMERPGIYGTGPNSNKLLKAHLGSKIAPGSIWPVLFPGLNSLEIGPSGSPGTGFTWEWIRFYEVYWGI